MRFVHGNVSQLVAAGLLVATSVNHCDDKTHTSSCMPFLGANAFVVQQRPQHRSPPRSIIIIRKSPTPWTKLSVTTNQDAPGDFVTETPLEETVAESSNNPVGTDAAPPPPPANSDTSNTRKDVDQTAVPPPTSVIVKRSLYEILQSSPNATRTELKRSYVMLAKESHPDALIGREDNIDIAGGGGMNNIVYSFSEIAQAWSILSDPKERKKYDRSLRAEAFTADVEKYSSQVSKQVGPPVRKAFEDIAIPFLRRTTATTFASVTAAAENFGKQTNSANDSTNNNNKKNNNLGSAFLSALKAGQSASLAIDRLELIERSKELERKATEEEKKALDMKKDLDKMVEQRLDLSLGVPNTNLSSADAMQILESLQTAPEEQVGIIGRTFGKHSLQSEIECLQQVETELQSKVQERNEITQKVDAKNRQFKQAEQTAELAVEAVIRARAALEKAQDLAEASKEELSGCYREMISIESVQKRTDTETTKLSTSLERKQEQVRIALYKKKLAVCNVEDDISTTSSSIDEEEAEEEEDNVEVASKELVQIQLKENVLKTEFTRLQDR
eukprot:scaffold151055_cov44-Attheya_sp.AAC.1